MAHWHCGLWLKNGGGIKGDDFPSHVFVMHFSSASYIVNQDNNAILWNDLN